MSQKPSTLVLIAFSEGIVRHQIRQRLIDTASVDLLEAVNAKDLYQKCIEFHPEYILCDTESFPENWHRKEKLCLYCQHIVIFSKNIPAQTDASFITYKPYPPSGALLQDTLKPN